jgi:hypothetical protein
MDLEHKYGPMERSMKENGDLIRLMESENSGMLMGMCMKESGLKIKLMDKEYIYILMERDIKVRFI